MSYNTNPNELKTCPYDSSHKIAASRFQTHLIKCKKSHPELAKTFEVCPFNASHRFLGSERNQHLFNCPDNRLIEEQLRTIKSKQEMRCRLPEATSSNIILAKDEDDDDWDTEEPQVSINLVRDSNRTSKRVESDEDNENERRPPMKYTSLGRGITRK